MRSNNTKTRRRVFIKLFSRSISNTIFLRTTYGDIRPIVIENISNKRVSKLVDGDNKVRTIAEIRFKSGKNNWPINSIINLLKRNILLYDAILEINAKLIRTCEHPIILYKSIFSLTVGVKCKLMIKTKKKLYYLGKLTELYDNQTFKIKHPLIRKYSNSNGLIQ